MARTIGLHSIHQRIDDIKMWIDENQEILVSLKSEVLFKLVPISTNIDKNRVLQKHKDVNSDIPKTHNWMTAESDSDDELKRRVDAKMAEGLKDRGLPG